MHRLGRAALLLTMCGIAAVAAGCAGSDLGPSRILVPITDVKSVAGNWSGNFLRDATTQQDLVKLTVNDDGTFEISSVRQIGILQGKGKALAQGGKLVLEGERGGSAVFSLYDLSGNKYLKGQARTKDGDTFSGELKPVK
jgi:hypothetical protein